MVDISLENITRSKCLFSNLHLCLYKHLLTHKIHNCILIIKYNIQNYVTIVNELKNFKGFIKIIYIL